MSGSAIGTIVGVAVAVPAMAAAGAVAVAGAVVKGAVWAASEVAEMHREYQRKRQLELQNTNRALENFTASMNQTLRAQSDAEARVWQKACDKLRTQAAGLDAAAAAVTDNIAGNCAMLRTNGRNAEQQLIRTLEQESKVLRDTAAAQYAKHRQTLEKEIAELRDMELQAAQRSSKAQVHELAKHWLEQAITALESLVQRDTASLVSRETAALRRSLKHAAEAYNTGLDEAALASAQTVMTETAALAWTLTEREDSRFQKRVKARILLGTTLQHITEERYIDFVNPDDGRELHLDLDRFTKGEYSRLQSEVESLMEKLDDVDCISTAQLDELAHIAAQARARNEQLAEYGTSAAGSYFDRLHCLTVIAAGLEERNNYKLQWTAAINDDPTEPIIIHLENMITGDRISIGLSGTDAESGFEIDVDNFAAPGRQIDEGYRSIIYDEIVELLESAMPGATASLHCCQGTAGQNSQNTENATREGVRRKAYND